jgi:hypothetical protein
MTQEQEKQFEVFNFSFDRVEKAKSEYELVNNDLGFSIYYLNVQDDVYSCYIPLLSIYYTACSYEDIKELAIALFTTKIVHSINMIKQHEL